jgi:hypothetical protein
MVKFNNKSFTIQVETGGNPIEDWLKTHEELVDMFQCQNMDLCNGNMHYNVLELLRSMMPDLETAKKMTK